MTVANMRARLRLADTSFDTEISSLMSAAKHYMRSAGVPSWETEDGDESPRCEAAMAAFVTGHFGRMPVDEAERADRAFNALVQQMALDSEDDNEDE